MHFHICFCVIFKILSTFFHTEADNTTKTQSIFNVINPLNLPYKIPYGMTMTKLNEIRQRLPNIPCIIEPNMRFYLYTRKNRDKYDELTTTITSIHRSHFDIRLEIIFLVHGWQASGLDYYYTKFKNCVLEQDSYNVINVDWNSRGEYISRAVCVEEAGKQLAKFIDFLVENVIYNIDQIRVIGSSLGAHVSGNAGRLIKSGKIPWITGLDPAGPGFQYVSVSSSTLRSSDADFVEVIHTDAGRAGFAYDIGDVDYYPNSGKPSQQGCYQLDVVGYASHIRAGELYMESFLGGEPFLGVRCESYQAFMKGDCCGNVVAQVGRNERSLGKNSGKYFFITGDKSPFAKGTAGLKECSTPQDNIKESVSTV